AAERARDSGLNAERSAAQLASPRAPIRWADFSRGVTMKPRPNARLVSLRNAADEVGLAYHTLYELIQHGHIPVVRLPGMRSLYIEGRDLDSAIDSWKEQLR